MIWIIGGTSEARGLVSRLKDSDNYIMTIATEAGLEFLNTDKVYVGRLNLEEMIQFVKEKSIEVIVDLSHPYATIVSDNAKKVSKQLKIKYIRYTREKSHYTDNVIYLNSYDECYEYLSDIKGTVFFTTGSKNVGDFEKVRGDNRFIYRVLPVIDSINICNENYVHMRDIVAILGPFTVMVNKAMLSEYKAKYCVMKDSGKNGGTVEKIQACKELGVVPVIIGRDKEEGISDLDEIFMLISPILHNDKLVYN